MRRTRLIPLIVASALFIENADSALVATALPTIAQDLRVDPLALKLALTSYLVALAIFIPISGWIADRLGARRTFVMAMGVFMAGSLSCALDTTLNGFIVSRFIQGVGGAMMVPVGRLIVLRSVPRTELVDAMAYLTIPGLLGPLVGPPLAGFVTIYGDWRWIFAINVPVGLVGIGFALKFLDDERPEGREPLDVRGFLITSVAATGLMAGLATFGRYLVPFWVSVTLVAVGLAAAALYVWHARRHPAPLIDFGLARIPTFGAGVFGGLLFRVGAGATPFLLPLMLQVAFGFDALQSGLITFATALGAISMKALAGRILRRFGYRRVVTYNGLLAAGMIAAMGLFTPTTPMFVIFGVLVVGGFLRSLQFTSLNTLSFADVEATRMSKATSLSGTTQNISQAFGIAVGAGVLELVSARHGGGLLPGDFTIAFLVMGLIAASASWMSWRLPATAGSSLIGTRQPRDGDREV